MDLLFTTYVASSLSYCMRLAPNIERARHFWCLCVCVCFGVWCAQIRGYNCCTTESKRKEPKRTSTISASYSTPCPSRDLPLLCFSLYFIQISILLIFTFLTSMFCFEGALFMPEHSSFLD
jgi:hypothetical protein